MNKTTLVVPEGIRFISDWKDYNLDSYQYPHILNKVLTGCGFTEYCINNPMNVILLSPRKMLLENKESQHPGEVFYARNEIENTVDFEKDIKLNKKSSNILFDQIKYSKRSDEYQQKILNYHDKIKSYALDCIKNQRPCKILVTYDSFRHVKKVLKDLGILERFYVVVDEFQSFLIDSRFKSGTEIEVLYQLQDLEKVCFVSATPLLDKYLDLLDEFKDLPYLELDWMTKEPERVCKPKLEIKFTRRGLNEEIKNIIQSYLDKRFDKKIYLDSFGVPSEIESKEAVIFVNSVKSIARAIVTNNLTLDQCNILCARTPDNEKVIRKAFNQVLEKVKLHRLSKSLEVIGSIPRRGEPHKMFTFCTRTVYLGADFYSTCAKTYIFSDSNIECLSVDISMDLEQILGRQRLSENPWKNSATVIIRTTEKILSREDFNKTISNKINSTKNLLLSYSSSPTLESKHELAKEYLRMADTFNYKNNYVSVNRHSGNDLVPVFNNLILVAEQRSFDIQQIDYKDRFSIFNTINEHFGDLLDNQKINEHIEQFEKYSQFPDKLKYLYEIVSKELDVNELNKFLNQIPQRFKDYYKVFNPSLVKSMSYRESLLLNEWNKIKGNSEAKEDLIKKIYQEFQEGSSYSNSFIKDKLREIYQSLGYKKSPKAVDIQEYFETKDTKITVDGKRSMGYKLLKKKEK